MQKIINMHEAKSTLSKLVEEAMNGSTIFIARNGKPVAKLVPLTEAVKGRVVSLHSTGTVSTPQQVAEAMAPIMSASDIEAWLSKM